MLQFRLYATKLMPARQCQQLNAIQAMLSIFGVWQILDMNWLGIQQDWLMEGDFALGDLILIQRLQHYMHIAKITHIINPQQYRVSLIPENSSLLLSRTEMVRYNQTQHKLQAQQKNRGSYGRNISRQHSQNLQTQSILLRSLSQDVPIRSSVRASTKTSNQTPTPATQHLPKQEKTKTLQRKRQRKHIQKLIEQSMSQAINNTNPRLLRIVSDQMSVSREELNPTRKQGSAGMELNLARKQASVPGKQVNVPGKQVSVCIELSNLMDKFARYVVKSWNSTVQSEQISSKELLRLECLLSAEFKLPLQGVLDEWLIERFIMLLKEMRQFKLSKYQHLEKLLEHKYAQIVQEVHSEHFHSLQIREERKKYIIAKIQAKSLDIYPLKI